MGRLAIRAGTFRADTDVGKTVDVTWTGECDRDVVDQLESFFDAVHTAATGTKPPRDVVLDLEGVDFMTSSCVTKLVAWLVRVRRLEAAARYKIRIRSNPKLRWQKRTLRAVQCYAPELVTLET